jgi:Tol biopolymer transport system component
MSPVAVRADAGRVTDLNQGVYPMFARRPLVLLALALVSLVAASAAHAAFPGANGRIVFSSDRESSSTSEIYSAAPDGSDVKRLTWTPFDWKQNPTWSPDGTKIAYEAPAQGRFHVFVMNFDGSDQTLVSPGVDSYSNFDDTDPSWSPDGTQLAFGSTRGGTWNIWVVNVDGSGLHRLNDHFGIQPTWSPDGAHIAYEADDAIREMNADGSGDHVLSAPPPGGYDDNPDWSPDGSRLVFAQRNFDGTASALYSIAADGSDQRQLTSGAFADYRPAWSPDGSKITFDRKDPVTGNRQLHVMNADGSGESQLMSSVRDDINGSWGTSTVSPIVSPPEAPQIQILSPEDGGIYLPGAGVIAFYICTSQVSFVVSCEGNLGLGEPVYSTPGTHQLTVTATDAEGRQSQASVSYTIFGLPDQTAPTISIDTPADGATYAQGENVTVHYSCADEPGGSGVGVCNGPVPDTAPLDTSNIGTFRFTVFAVDQAGNRATATSTYQVVDRTPPTISIAAPADHAVYMLGQSVPADYTCADQPGGSGIASCSGPVAAGAAIDTSSVGAKTFTVTATDRAGNVAHASRSYSVVYDFAGFFSPVTAAYPTANSFRAGESIPFKFRLQGNQGLDVLAAGSPVWAPCGGGGTTPARGSLSYNASNDRYTYLATTDKAWNGTCRDLVLTLRDGTSHRARIAFG